VLCLLSDIAFQLTGLLKASKSILLSLGRTQTFPSRRTSSPAPRRQQHLKRDRQPTVHYPTCADERRAVLQRGTRCRATHCSPYGTHQEVGADGVGTYRHRRNAARISGAVRDAEATRKYIRRLWYIAQRNSEII
jgi:hypothetical protein